MNRNTKIALIIASIVLIIGSFYLGRKSASYEIVEKVEQHHSNPEKTQPSQPLIEHTTSQENNSAAELKTGNVPNYALETLRYIRENNKAPEGYVGGRVFQNREKLLPKTDENGNTIRYQEWDVHPKIEGKNRGAERLVTSEDEAYYTEDHYKSFIKIQE